MGKPKKLKQPKKHEHYVVINGAEYPHRYVEGVMSDWVAEGIIR